LFYVYKNQLHIFRSAGISKSCNKWTSDTLTSQVWSNAVLSLPVVGHWKVKSMELPPVA
jgi:hypothetical protein